jgi:hypothetical protein
MQKRRRVDVGTHEPDADFWKAFRMLTLAGSQEIITQLKDAEEESTLNALPRPSVLSVLVPPVVLASGPLIYIVDIVEKGKTIGYCVVSQPHQRIIYLRPVVSPTNMDILLGRGQGYKALFLSVPVLPKHVTAFAQLVVLFLINGITPEQMVSFIDNARKPAKRWAVVRKVVKSFMGFSQNVPHVFTINMTGDAYNDVRILPVADPNDPLLPLYGYPTGEYDLDAAVASAKQAVDTKETIQQANQQKQKLILQQPVAPNDILLSDLPNDIFQNEIVPHLQVHEAVALQSSWRNLSKYGPMKYPFRFNDGQKRYLEPLMYHAMPDYMKEGEKNKHYKGANNQAHARGALSLARSLSRVSKLIISANFEWTDDDGNEKLFWFNPAYMRLLRDAIAILVKADKHHHLTKLVIKTGEEWQFSDDVAVIILNKFNKIKLLKIELDGLPEWTDDESPVTHVSSDLIKAITNHPTLNDFEVRTPEAFSSAIQLLQCIGQRKIPIESIITVVQEHDGPTEHTAAGALLQIDQALSALLQAHYASLKKFSFTIGADTTRAKLEHAKYLPLCIGLEQLEWHVSNLFDDDTDHGLDIVVLTKILYAAQRQLSYLNISKTTIGGGNTPVTKAAMTQFLDALVSCEKFSSIILDSNWKFADEAQGGPVLPLQLPPDNWRDLRSFDFDEMLSERSIVALLTNHTLWRLNIGPTSPAIFRAMILTQCRLLHKGQIMHLNYSTDNANEAWCKELVKMEEDMNTFYQNSDASDDDESEDDE